MRRRGRESGVYNRGVITVDEAYRALDRAVLPAGAETIALADACGRVLSADLVSDVDWPPFDTSAMDGYAVIAADLAQEAVLEGRPGLVAAGDPPPAGLRSGEAVKVMTGAPLPRGADAVVPVEEARSEGTRVRFGKAPAPGAHVRRRGESVRSGSVLVAAGERLGPAGVALAALAGSDPVRVRRQPRVAIAATGNELVSAGEKPGAGQLRDSNGPLLAALCRVRGWPARVLDRVADEPRAVERLFESGPDDSDVLVTTGGVSAGDLDLLPPAAERAGWEMLFHRVAVRPGKPLACARRGDVLWFGLPGNPVSASVGFHLFVRRALDRFEGAARPGAVTVAAKLARGLPATGPRETYRDAVLADVGGERRVEPLVSAGSHDLAAHARANALIRLPAGGDPLPAESIVTCVLLER